MPAPQWLVHKPVFQEFFLIEKFVKNLKITFSVEVKERQIDLEYFLVVNLRHIFTTLSKKMKMNSFNLRHTHAHIHIIWSLDKSIQNVYMEAAAAKRDIPCCLSIHCVRFSLSLYTQPYICWLCVASTIWWFSVNVFSGLIIIISWNILHYSSI